MGADAVWPKPYPASAQMAADLAGWIRTTAEGQRATRLV
jgi:hypothetical protein